MKKIVIPGEVLYGERKKLGNNVFVSDGKIYSRVLGIVDTENESATVVPLEGPYVPRREDSVVGVVTRENFAGYGVNINSFNECFIPKSAMRVPLRLGEIIFAKVSNVNELKEADLSFPKKMTGGEVIKVNPVRSPRLIGKSGSMLDLLSQGTGCELFIGKNGRLWARNGNMELLKRVVKFIEENSYKSNLTNAVEVLLKKEN
jgi:exosome complex component RRP4